MFRVERSWEGRTVAVIATGPSLTLEQAEQVRHMPAVAVNDAWRVAPWAEVRYAADAGWWHANPQAVEFDGLRICAQQNAPAGVSVIRVSGIHGFDPDPHFVRSGGNSGYQAIHVAIHAGATRILLLGFDMRGTHFFGLHQPPLRNTTPETFRRWVGRFAALRDRGAEIVNCTPGSALTAFPMMDIREALA